MCVVCCVCVCVLLCVVFFQAEDGIRDLVRSRGLGDVYKRQVKHRSLMAWLQQNVASMSKSSPPSVPLTPCVKPRRSCLLYTSDAADERSSVDLGGRRIIKKKNRVKHGAARSIN